VSCFVQRRKFVTRHVICLPPQYNGDIIFELPPIEDEGKKVTGCSQWKEQKIVITGHKLSQLWSRFQRWKGSRYGNSGKYCVLGLWNAEMISVVIIPKINHGMQVHGQETTRCPSFTLSMSLSKQGGLMCSFCNRRPYCTAACPASVFYMYPKRILPNDIY
jgi:hypothetical protein